MWGLRSPTPRGPLLDAQKRTEKPLEPEVPDLPLGAALWARRLGGGFAGDWMESLMDGVPRELEVLRGSDLGAWQSTNSACRPFKRLEPSIGGRTIDRFA